MEAELLREALEEYRNSATAIAEALEANPDEAELLELKEQLEGAIAEAEAALAGLHDPEAAGDTSAAAAGAAADAQTAAAPEPASATPPPQPAPGHPQAAASQPRGAAPARGNARIHPRSKYAFEAPDFAALARLYPSLQPYLLQPRGDAGRQPGSSDAGQDCTEGSQEDATADAAAAATERPSEQQPLSAPRAGLDFTNPAACRELTRVLLRHDFGLEWWVPAGQLVPPVTNRANYVHWLEDLLALSAPQGPVAGLDIGCGANLIYCLLGSALCGWHMVGADVEPAALRWAAQNLGANPQLQGRVELRAVEMQAEQRAFFAGGRAGGGQGVQDGSGKGGKGGGQAQAQALGQALAAAEADVQPNSEDVPPPAIATASPAPIVRLSSGSAAGGGIVSGAVRRGERFAFCMCNPPFFESMEEAGRNPATAFGGTAVEMVYPGGELAFVSGMVNDSLSLRGAVHWYTTMVGKKGTLRAVRSLLYRHGVRVLRTTELAQGKTSRWALAWSFSADPSAATLPLPRFPAAGAAGPAIQQAAGRGGPAAAAGAGAGAGGAGATAGQARPVGRKASWQVQAPPRAGAAVLAAMRQCLRQAGAQCSDAGPYCLAGRYAPSAQELAAAAGAAEGGQEEAAAGPAAKRPRVDAASADGGRQHGKQAQQGQQAWQVDLQLFQQHPGLFLLTASLHKSAPDAALPWFESLARRLQAALAAQWTVQA